MLKKYSTLLLSLVTLFLSLSLHAESLSPLFRNATDPTAGNAKGKVTVVEFFDYLCIHCIHSAKAIDASIKANPNVRFVFKELPVSGAASELATRAALAANLQGKYYAFHSALFSNKKPINDALITEIAKKLELNVRKLKNDMNSEQISNEIISIHRLAISLGVRGTPTFYIAKTDADDMKNVKTLLGAVTQTQLDATIDQASN